MERLTKTHNQRYEPADIFCLEWIGECLARLAAIEDILGDEYDLERLRELAQADREGRVHIYGKSHKCPICGAYRLVPRVDGQFYFCFHCKNQVTSAEAETALRRE